MQQNIEFLSDDLTLEGIISKPVTRIKIPCVILCHPHPLYGGNMLNEVNINVAQTLYELGIASLLFNFRGVGNSQGTFENGKGEVRDLTSAYNFISNLPNINSDKIGVSGYSFGASIALELLFKNQQNTKIKSFAFMSCPSTSLENLYQQYLTNNADLLNNMVETTKVFVYGDQDELINQNTYTVLLKHFCKPNEIYKIKGTNHIFTGDNEENSKIIGDFFHSTLK